MTDRLRLRPLRESDRDHLMEIFSDPIAMKYYERTKSIQEAQDWIAWNHRNYHVYKVGLWAVVSAEDGHFLGQCGIVPQKVNDEILMEIGYSFIRDHWGKGFATEAARACLQHGFHTCEFPKMISLIDPNNKPSIAVAKRIGMERETQIMKWNRRIDIYSKSRIMEER
ncbi:GNAT family N-acetyltransferase [Pseudalkalibacillus berkeleyi]|uniref:GNAT family N-acetyltransferase n=1 Tax=Pseudalkalibacillus berkeleyi TaxID=1069813 RepID=A0ABS9GU26_9BACL|nr:GNAT family N-acetyltransferase [Pseudalkalibacillus berkeleyi]MCF6136347.1 GNAT family N-acetyltransferase [Pseudalkalibacillus berkeleyi]